MLAARGVLGWMDGAGWSRGLLLWLVLAAILVATAFLHIIGTWRTRRYAPGLVTGVLLNLPLGIWGFWHFPVTGQASFQLAATSLVFGASYDIWSNLSHRARAALMARNARPERPHDDPRHLGLDRGL